MAKQRLKRIQAGRLVREVLWSASFPTDTLKARAEKAKTSSAARQKINLRCSWQKLKLVLAANFDYTDLHVTLTYDDAHLPPDKDAARKLLKKFLVQLRDYRRAHGGDVYYVYCTEDKHGDGRIHHHIVINGTGQDYDLIRSLWIYGSDVYFATIDQYGYDELAKYLTKEPREYGKTDVGGKTWVPSHNLHKPEVSPTEWVPESVMLSPPANAYILSREGFENEWGRYSFVEYLLPEPPPNWRARPRSGPKRKKE